MLPDHADFGMGATNNMMSYLLPGIVLADHIYKMGNRSALKR